MRFAFLPALLLAACGADLSTPDGAAEASLDAMDDMISVIEDVESESDIESAKAEFKDISNRLKEIHDKIEGFSKEDKDACLKQMQKGMEERKDRIGKAMENLAAELQMKLGMAISEAMKQAGADPSVFR